MDESPVSDVMSPRAFGFVVAAPEQRAASVAELPGAPAEFGLPTHVSAVVLWPLRSQAPVAESPVWVVVPPRAF
ncbi:hypothetical protein [Nocardia amikacinitolerans]|uniref:hypothetical protein n=1 Tax=Nocardia amikacinitolerans TaxID=756689 RepID=UPI000830607A|nr:hypothetical protein [Nocardia amikacinitolerans]